MPTQADSSPTTIVWYRLDLRTDDHLALDYASQRGNVVPAFVAEDHKDSGSLQLQAFPMGGASKWWLHHSLRALSESLEELGSPLVLRRGDPLHQLIELCKESGADQVALHESTEPDTQEFDDQLEIVLEEACIELVRFSADVLWPVGSVLTGSAKPYQVFTPFWNRAITIQVDDPVPPPESLQPPSKSLRSLDLDSLELLHPVDWAAGFRERWEPGEHNAKKSFQSFIEDKVDEYDQTRNQLSVQGWSQLSASIHFGELSVRRMWHTLSTGGDWEKNPGVSAYLRQLGWHDFAIHLLNHFPHTVDAPFRSQFEKFQWATNDEHLTRWKKGMTGYPIVDAAMRNLWAEGWMPNRARMIVASFLCKDLLISWESGAEWFWDTLVDADLANNILGWQWTAGCGADAAPYFRVFNPVSQGKKFDPKGEYVRRWVPELAQLPASIIHSPWEAPPLTLLNYGVTLGDEYPHPVVDHAEARLEALKAFEATK
jgi:deoxyribodipyrimidine photo-lyase